MKRLPIFRRCRFCGEHFKRLDSHERKHRVHVWAEFANNPIVQLAVYGRYRGFVQLQLEYHK